MLDSLAQFSSSNDATRGDGDARAGAGGGRGRDALPVGGVDVDVNADSPAPAAAAAAAAAASPPRRGGLGGTAELLPANAKKSAGESEREHERKEEERGERTDGEEVVFVPRLFFLQKTTTTL